MPSRELTASFLAHRNYLAGILLALLALSEISYLVLFAIFMTPAYFAGNIRIMGIMTPMHWIQPGTTTKIIPVLNIFHSAGLLSNLY